MKVPLSMNNRRPIAARDCEEPLPASIWRWRPDPIPFAVEPPQDGTAARLKTGIPSSRADQQVLRQFKS